METEIIAIFIPIVAIISAVVMIIYLRKYENEERMSMIDKGLNPHDGKVRRANPSIALRFALLFMGVGTGLFMGYFLDAYSRMEETGYFSMIFLFGGIGLLASYFIEEKKNKKELEG